MENILINVESLSKFEVSVTLGFVVQYPGPTARPQAAFNYCNQVQQVRSYGYWLLTETLCTAKENL